MIITRWQAPLTPTAEQIISILTSEDMEPYKEILSPSQKVREHRHQFCEIRVIVQGEMIFNVLGTQFVLRPGDRVEIPANTRHSHMNQSDKECISICGKRAI